MTLPVPTLDEIVCNPSLARELAPRVVASLLGQAHVAIAALGARLLVASVERNEPRPADHEPARLMTAAEVSVRLGFKRGYIYELARAGKIKALRQGKYTRFTEAALLEYIAGNDAAASLGISKMLSSGLTQVSNLLMVWCMDPEQFKSGRSAIGLTQTELATRLGVHPLTVSRWERGFSLIPNPVEKLMQLWVKARRGGRRKR